MNSKIKKILALFISINILNPNVKAMSKTNLFLIDKHEIIKRNTVIKQRERKNKIYQVCFLAYLYMLVNKLDEIRLYWRENHAVHKTVKTHYMDFESICDCIPNVLLEVPGDIRKISSLKLQSYFNNKILSDLITHNKCQITKRILDNKPLIFDTVLNCRFEYKNHIYKLTTEEIRNVGKIIYSLISDQIENHKYGTMEYITIKSNQTITKKIKNLGTAAVKINTNHESSNLSVFAPVKSGFSILPGYSPILSNNISPQEDTTKKDNSTFLPNSHPCTPSPEKPNKSELILLKAKPHLPKLSPQKRNAHILNYVFNLIFEKLNNWIKNDHKGNRSDICSFKQDAETLIISIFSQKINDLCLEEIFNGTPESQSSSKKTFVKNLIYTNNFKNKFVKFLKDRKLKSGLNYKKIIIRTKSADKIYDF